MINTLSDQGDPVSIFREYRPRLGEARYSANVTHIELQDVSWNAHIFSHAGQEAMVGLSFSTSVSAGIKFLAVS